MVCKTCVGAMPDCATCTAAAVCTSCSTKKLAVVPASCIDACPATAYEATNKCYACTTVDADCTACTASNVCTTCGTKKLAVGSASCIDSCAAL